MRIAVALILALTIGLAHGTIVIPPTLAELVAGSKSIGLVQIQRAELYEETDAEGVIACGVLYVGEWVDSLTGDVGRIEFTSGRQVLAVKSTYLVFLAANPLRRKLVSTNSWMERERSTRLRRERQCSRSAHLLQTATHSAEMVYDYGIATELNQQIWVEKPYVSKSGLLSTTIFPSRFKVDGTEIPRDQITDESGYQLLQPGGYGYFTAVRWTDYCAKLVETVLGPHQDSSSQLHSFCQPKSAVSRFD